MHKFILAVAAALTPFPLTADNFIFSGTYWETGGGHTYEAVGLGIPASDMKKAFRIHTDDGLEMTHIDVYDVEGSNFFNFVFNKRTSRSWIARWGMSGGKYQEVFDNNVAAGRCLRALDIYRKGSSPRYAAIFKKKGCKPQAAYHGLTSQQHQQEFNTLTDAGWDPVTISVVSIDGQRIYAAFYEKQNGGFVTRSFLTRDQLAEEDAKQIAAGRRIVHMDAYTHDQGQLPRFAAIWRKVGKPSNAWANIGGPQVFDVGSAMHGAGEYVRYLTGYGAGSGHRFDLSVFRPKSAADGPSDISN